MKILNKKMFNLPLLFVGYCSVWRGDTVQNLTNVYGDMQVLTARGTIAFASPRPLKKISFLKYIVTMSVCPCSLNAPTSPQKWVLFFFFFLKIKVFRVTCKNPVKLAKPPYCSFGQLDHLQLWWSLLTLQKRMEVQWTHGG